MCFVGTEDATLDAALEGLLSTVVTGLGFLGDPLVRGVCTLGLGFLVRGECTFGGRDLDLSCGDLS